MKNNFFHLVVVGTGYVGLTTGAALAYLGHQVICVDKDHAKIAMLRKGICPIKEMGLASMMQRARHRMTFEDRLQEVAPDADIILIAVGTPSLHDGRADTSYVQKAVHQVAEAMDDGKKYIVVVKSTVPIGTNRKVAHEIQLVLRKRSCTAKAHVVSNPEFLSEARALRDFLYPDRIVVGVDSMEGLDMMRQLYRPVLEQTFDPLEDLPRPQGYSLPTLITTDPISAEMIKYASNAFLAAKISFINEIACLCEKVGADVLEVSRGMGLDSRIGPHFLQAGVGWGGSCFPKDTSALIALGRENNCEMPMISAARLVNFTNDIREAPALEIIQLLLERGAKVRVHDPLVLQTSYGIQGLVVEFCEDPYTTAEGADALVLVTEWPQYKELDLSQLAANMRTPILLDGRNLFDPNEARKAGWTYLGVGR